METAYIGLGGNLGDVVATMSGALQQIDAHSDIKVVAVSPVYRTRPWGVEDQDWFHNACAKLETRMEPIELLDECLKIERFFKRERRVRWGPRTLDLDIMVFGDRTINEERLSIPHPRITERAFVMKPLDDIAPEIEVQGKQPSQWLETLEDNNPQRVDLPENWWKIPN